MLKITSTFLWRERRGSLAEAHGGENELVAWRIHGENDGGREVWMKMEKRELRENVRRERK